MAAIRQKVQRVVYSSSASVYGDAVEIPMTEDHAYNNFTFYGASKIAGEHFFKSLGRRYGLNWVGLRYMNVYGPRQDYKGAYIAVMHKILDRIERGESPLVYGDGSQQYDFVHVSRRRPGERAGHAGRRAGTVLQRRPRHRHDDQGTDRAAAATDRQQSAHSIRAGRIDVRDQPHRLSEAGRARAGLPLVDRSRRRDAEPHRVAAGGRRVTGTKRMAVGGVKSWKIRRGRKDEGVKGGREQGTDWSQADSSG